MSCTCHQCGYVFGSQAELAAHLMAEHGLNCNPVRSLPNLYEIVERLIKQVNELTADTEAEIQALDSRLDDLEEPEE